MEHDVESLLVDAIAKALLEELVLGKVGTRGAEGVLELEEVLVVGARDGAELLDSVLRGLGEIFIQKVGMWKERL